MRLFLRMTSLMAILAASIVTTSAPASADQFQDILDAGKIRIGVPADVPPFGFLDENQEPAGLDIELSKMLAEELGVEAELQPITGQNRIPYLATNKVDIVIAILSVTPERAKQIMFSSPYGNSLGGVFGADDLTVSDVAELGNKSIGVARGTTNDLMLSKVAPNANVVRFEDDATAQAAYQSGQVDLIATGSVVAYAVNKGSPNRRLNLNLTFGVNTAHVGVRIGEFTLLQWINAFIFYHRLNGDLDALSRKWIDAPFADVPTL
jgi:polar amino acid transport system substrate-binding protein